MMVLFRYVNMWNSSLTLRALRAGGKLLHWLTRQPRWILYCTVLYCTVLYCTVLQAAALAHPPAQVKTAVSERIVLTDAFQIQGRGDLQAV